MQLRRLALFIVGTSSEGIAKGYISGNGSPINLNLANIRFNNYWAMHIIDYLCVKAYYTLCANRIF